MAWRGWIIIELVLENAVSSCEIPKGGSARTKRMELFFTLKEQWNQHGENEISPMVKPDKKETGWPAMEKPFSQAAALSIFFFFHV